MTLISVVVRTKDHSCPGEDTFDFMARAAVRGILDTVPANIAEAAIVQETLKLQSKPQDTNTGHAVQMPAEEWNIAVCRPIETMHRPVRVLRLGHEHTNAHMPSPLRRTTQRAG